MIVVQRSIIAIQQAKPAEYSPCIFGLPKVLFLIYNENHIA